MDIDLQDAMDHANAQDQPSALSREALAGLDASRQITALMLAKHYLPEIIVGHGAMPIREMMAHLAQSVPGFSGLHPPKARRLVVAALEHRAGGGLNGEVKFEKVGWGRWSVAGSGSGARGMPINGSRSGNGVTPPASLNSNSGTSRALKSRNNRDVDAGSWVAGSWSPKRHDEDEEMADQMSLDGSGDSADSDSASDMDLEEDLNDDTDQEDWSTVGPQSYRSRGPRGEYRDYNHLSRTQTSDPRYRSVPRPQPYGRTLSPVNNSFLSVSASRGNHAVNAGTSLPASAVTGTERDAIEALVAMGSM